MVPIQSLEQNNKNENKTLHSNYLGVCVFDGKVSLKFACANKNMNETGLKVYRMDERETKP